MKKNILFLLAFLLQSLLFNSQSFGQGAPQATAYQAVARDNNGNLIVNRNIAVRFSILDGSATGAVVYEETQSTTTNAFGLFTVNLGQGNQVSSQPFSSIDWGGNTKWIKIESDLNGGSNYIQIGTPAQLLSVPYALYAGSVSKPEQTIDAGNTTPSTIPNLSCTGATSNILLSGLPSTVPSNQITVTINITMQNVVDLDIFLIAPNGDVLFLAGAGYLSGHNFTNTIFSDNGSNFIYDGAAPFTGTFRPDDDYISICDLSSTVIGFGGIGRGSINPNGSWTLRIFDQGGHSANTGVLLNWSISAISPGSQANYLPKWTSSGSLSSSSDIYDDGLGRVGIGTKDPANALSVEGSADFVRVGIGTTVPANTLSVAGNADFSGTVSFGRVGIGTSSPTKALHIYGSGELEIAIQSTDPGAHSWTLQGNGTGSSPSTFQIWDRTVGQPRLGIDNSGNFFLSGNVGIGTTNPSNILSVAGGADFNGKVGIGTSTPAKSLHVYGGGDQEIAIESTDPDAHQWTLQSNGSLTGSPFSFQIIDRTSVKTRIGFDNTGGVAIGNFVSTNLHPGCIIMADASHFGFFKNDADNQFNAMFAGGYNLYSNDAKTTGVSLYPGNNGWSSVSDRRKKENLAAVNGEDFLKKIGGFDLSSWNYKGQDAKAFRHYGPMAQDFFAAFGKDSYGTIGNDTTISQTEMEGVSFIAIKALVKRTDELKIALSELKQVKSEMKAMKQSNETMESELHSLKAMLEKSGVIPKQEKSTASSSIVK